MQSEDAHRLRIIQTEIMCRYGFVPDVAQMVEALAGHGIVATRDEVFRDYEKLGWMKVKE